LINTVERSAKIKNTVKVQPLNPNNVVYDDGRSKSMLYY